MSNGLAAAPHIRRRGRARCRTPHPRATADIGLARAPGTVGSCALALRKRREKVDRAKGRGVRTSRSASSCFSSWSPGLSASAACTCSASAAGRGSRRRCGGCIGSDEAGFRLACAALHHHNHIKRVASRAQRLGRETAASVSLRAGATICSAPGCRYAPSPAPCGTSRVRPTWWRFYLGRFHLK